LGLIFKVDLVSLDPEDGFKAEVDLRVITATGTRVSTFNIPFYREKPQLFVRFAIL
jgi:hypothetical protein